MAEGTSCTAIEREHDVPFDHGTTALFAKMKTDHAVSMEAIMKQHCATARMHKLELARMKNELEKKLI